ncbi:MAG: DUF6460 domain-containing protein [Candidatus Devosia phytovorans]|uniref:DUF6460 domain-containing protein n=1 Tax=Candidatus Devosia phytovorans TaxID=3121372 RepID=A0AAJ5VTQ2_9HYPH|nr:DUF6460 domain-containing protein [Devosia sp.]WEK03318.1 MAG: DUF6460 domain-containing protein [Devosia sp.]
MTDQPRSEPRRSPLERFFGGHPLSVILKLAVISLLVGIVMRMFGFDALDLVHGAVEMICHSFRDGLGAFRDIGIYIATGAAIVVPIWLILRLSKRR